MLSHSCPQQLLREHLLPARTGHLLHRKSPEARLLKECLLHNGLRIGADCWQATCSLEASSYPQATICYFLQGREVLSCCRRGEKEEMLYMSKMLMFRSCVLADFVSK